MSPEQASGDLDGLGPRSAVYSLGETLYCLLTGKAPFEGDDIGEILRRVQAGSVRATRELDPGAAAADQGRRRADAEEVTALPLPLKMK
jgi:eukaryotic-like serine/threonine-protein kinase